MDQRILRLLIQEKLADGRLPHDPFPSIRSRQGTRGDLRWLRGDRDQNPDADGDSRREGMPGPGSRRVLLPVGRGAPGVRTRAERPSSCPIRVHGPRRPSGPAMATHRAGSPSGRFRGAMTLQLQARRSPGGRVGPGRGRPSETLRQRCLPPETRDGCARPAATAHRWTGSRHHQRHGDSGHTAAHVRPEFVLVFFWGRRIETEWSMRGPRGLRPARPPSRDHERPRAGIDLPRDCGGHARGGSRRRVPIGGSAGGARQAAREDGTRDPRLLKPT